MMSLLFGGATQIPGCLIVGTIRERLLGRRIDLNRHRNREVRTNDRCFPLLEVGEERRGAAVNFTARSLNHLAVAVVREAMNNQRADLAENALGKIPWPLCCKAEIEPVLSPFTRATISKASSRTVESSLPT